MPIKDIPRYLRPREKAKIKGLSSLDDVELLALFLRSGTKDFDVIDLSRFLISKFKSIKGLVNAPMDELINIKGLGETKSLELKAILELIIRIAGIEEETINNETDALKLAWQLIGNEMQEKFLIILLNKQNELIYHEVLYKGSESKIPMNPKDVVALALKRNAKKFYCFHNHPSGDCQPSDADKLTTKRIEYFAELFDIQMLGHYVVNAKKEYSMVK